MVKFLPTAKGAATGTLAVSSDDPRHTAVSITLMGKGT
jgi:hypothetical protein